MRLTEQQAALQRHARLTVAAEKAVEIQSVAGALRTHARRCRTEAGYKIPSGENRSNYALFLSGFAKKIEHRRTLRLSLKYWLDRARAVLTSLEKENG